MMPSLVTTLRRRLSLALVLLIAALAMPFGAPLLAQASTAPPSGAGGEASLIIPDLSRVTFLGIDGHSLLMSGLVVCVLGLLFGMVIYRRLKNLPVHSSMREISELIYETCKTYLQNQGKFILLLWVFIGLIAAVYFGMLAPTVEAVAEKYAGNAQPRWHRGQLWRCVVRHSCEHVRQFAHGVRESPREAVSLLSDSALGGHEHRDVAHFRRARADAVHPALYPT